jgi:CHAD domain-containing protein
VLLGAPTGRVKVKKAVKRAGRRADRRLARAGESVERLHEARKAAKRARYAAEAAGGPAATVARHERVQDLLGRHHDLAMAAAFVHRGAVPEELGAQAAGLERLLRAEAEAVRREAIACLT